MNRYEQNIETGETTEIALTEIERDEYEKRSVETAWRLLRNERDARLGSSDWTVMADTPTNTAAWKAYRQALRDLPANTTDPFNPVWPTPPS